MDAPGPRIDQPRQGIDISRFKLGKLAVFKNEFYHRVRVTQGFQHRGLRRPGTLLLLFSWDVEFLEQYVSELLRRIDIKLVARALVDLAFEGFEPVTQPTRHIFQDAVIQQHAVPLHTDQYRDKWNFQVLEECP